MVQIKITKEQIKELKSDKLVNVGTLILGTREENIVLGTDKAINKKFS